MATRTLTLTRDIAAPPDAVWQILTDPAGSEQVLSGVSSIEMLTDGPYRVGTRWKETRSFMGGSETEEMWVTAVDEPRSTVLAAEARGATYGTTFHLEPIPTGTRLTMEFGGEETDGGLIKRVLMTVPNRLGLMMAKKMMRQDLVDIAAAAEARPSS
ncbi:SRPBCC family protein [Georgenia sp. Z1491]|uniref:SRPBCC family protein n=1 Tax=Georgenia sp. Z1491 TaxID=3416707 RepID=UPI003CEB92E6